jgi:hypothetical protein
MVVAFNTINLHKGYNRFWQRQTIRELELDGILQYPIKSRTPSLDEVYTEDEITTDRTETFKYCQSETLVKMVQDPTGQWKGENLYSLIDIFDIDNQGNLRYPKTHSAQVFGSPVVLSNNQEALLVGDNLAFNPETIHYKKLESLVEVVNNPELISSQITAASIVNFLHLDQIGTLKFPSYPTLNK